MAKRKKKGKGNKKKQSPRIVKVTAEDKTVYMKRDFQEVTSAYENKRWHELLCDVTELIDQDVSVMFKTNKKGELIPFKPIAKREKAFSFLSDRYVKYYTIAKKLDDVFKYMVHPQKRTLTRTILIDIFARILELKEHMVKVDERDFHFLDDVIQDLGIIPKDIDLVVPSFYMEDQLSVIRSRESLLDNMLQTAAASSVSVVNDIRLQTARSSLTIRAEIILIQKNHRGYLTRKYVDKIFGNNMRINNKSKTIYLYKKYGAKWLGFMDKRRVKAMRQKHMLCLGLAEEPDTDFVSFLDNHQIRNRIKAVKNEDLLEQDKIMTEESILDNEGYEMAWQLKYNITQWLLETKELMGTFPVYPPEDKGGSLLLFSNKSIADVQKELAELKSLKAKKEQKAKTEKKAKKEKKKDKKKGKDKGKGKGKRKKKKPGEAEEFEWEMPISNIVPELADARDSYREYWYYKDDSANYNQVHDAELLKDEVRLKTAETVRLQVDELMRFELENMKVAIERAKEGKKKKKKKKGKKEKEKKGKKKKDLTADRTMVDLYHELVQNGIVCKPERTRLSDFLGDYSYTGWITQKSNLNSLPSLADVRKLILEYSILPLGSSEVHEMAPLNRAVLISGLRGTGKTMLVNAICTEAGANLFDIRPSNLIGKYDSKQGKKMLMHLLIKVGKALEPTVFVIEDCERMFLKKKDKTDKSKPQQWVKPFKKMLKQIKNGDKMMVIGVTKRPHLSKSAMAKFFKRLIVVPHPDYGSRFIMWKHFITKISGLKKLDLDLTSLTKVTTGYSVQAIKAACEELLSRERLQTIFLNTPLCTYEFVEKIAKYDPIYRKEHAALLSWFEKTPAMKSRLARLGISGGEKDKVGKGKGKKKEKKKKK